MGSAICLAVVIDAHVSTLDGQGENDLMVTHELELGLAEESVEAEVVGLQGVLGRVLTDVVELSERASVFALVILRGVDADMIVMSTVDGILPQGSELGVEIRGRERCAISFKTHFVGAAY